MVNNSAVLDAVFSALADPTRRQMVERLARGPLTVGELARGFAMSQPAISKHVRVLESSGLLQREIQGRVHYCALSPQAMHAASAWIETQRHYWNLALDRLDDVLKRTSQRKKKES